MKYFAHVAYKNDIWKNITIDVPWEVMAQIDFETGHHISSRGTFYNAHDSSSSVYISLRRLHLGWQRKKWWRWQKNRIEYEIMIE